MKLRRLLNALHARDLWKNLSQEASLIQKFKGSPRTSLGEHLGQLVAYSLTADKVDFWCQSSHGGSRCGVQLEAEAGSEAHGAQHAQVVFFKAQLGLADSANDAGIDVSQAAHVIDHRSAKILMELFRKIALELLRGIALELFWKIALELFRKIALELS
jgi:hypothetical protein